MGFVTLLVVIVLSKADQRKDEQLQRSNSSLSLYGALACGGPKLLKLQHSPDCSRAYPPHWLYWPFKETHLCGKRNIIFEIDIFVVFCRLRIVVFRIVSTVSRSLTREALPARRTLVRPRPVRLQSLSLFLAVLTEPHDVGGRSHELERQLVEDVARNSFRQEVGGHLGGLQVLRPHYTSLLQVGEVEVLHLVVS